MTAPLPVPSRHRAAQAILATVVGAGGTWTLVTVVRALEYRAALTVMLGPVLWWPSAACSPAPCSRPPRYAW